MKQMGWRWEALKTTLVKVRWGLGMSLTSTFSYEPAQILNNPFLPEQRKNRFLSHCWQNRKRNQCSWWSELECFPSAFTGLVSAGWPLLRGGPWAPGLSPSPVPIMICHFLLDSFHRIYHFLKLYRLLIYTPTYFMSPQLESKLHEGRTVAAFISTESLLQQCVVHSRCSINIAQPGI